MPLRRLMPARRPAVLAVLLLTLGATLDPHPAAAHAILIASQPPQGGTVAPGTVAIHLQYNSRIDRARSRLTLTRPDHSQATLPIAAEGAPDEMNTAATLTAGRLCAALAGAGDRRPHHPRRRSLHRGSLTRGPADRPVRLPVHRRPRPDHPGAVDRARRRVLPGVAGAPARPASRRAGRGGGARHAAHRRLGRRGAAAVRGHHRRVADRGAGRHRRSQRRRGAGGAVRHRRPDQDGDRRRDRRAAVRPRAPARRCRCWSASRWWNSPPRP